MRRVGAEELLHGAEALLRRHELVPGGRRRGRLDEVGPVAAADRGGEHELRHREGPHARDHRLRRIPADERPLDEVVRQSQRVGQAALDPVEDQLLELASRSKSCPGELTRAAGVLPSPRQRDRLDPLSVCSPLSSLRLKAPPETVEQTSVGRSTVTPPIESMKSAEAVEVDDRHLVDVDAEEVLDSLDRELGAADRVGGVDLLRAVTGDVGEGVARNRELAEGAAAGPDQHDRVGPVGSAARRRGLAAARRLEAVLRRGLVAPANSPERMSVPRTRIVCGLTARNGLPWSVSSTPSASFDFWICEEIANARKLIRIQAPHAISTHLHDSAVERSASRPARLAERLSFGSLGRFRPACLRRSDCRSGARRRLRNPGRER